jgi:hypothetical protein
MDVMEATYAVALCDYPHLPEHERTRAEARYARVLERQFGGAAQVAQALHIVQGLEDTPPEEITEAAKSVFRQWGKASQAAGQAGFQGLGEAEGCYFEVRLV